MPRLVEFPTLESKAGWLDAAASEDATSPELERIARLIVGGKRGFWALRELHRYVRDRVAFRADRAPPGVPGVRPGTRIEEFADALTVLRRMYDDCDGKVRTFVALVRALGDPTIRARVLPVFRRHPFDFVHVQAHVKYPGSEHDQDNENGWRRAELIVRGVDIGDDPLLVPRDEHGRIPLAGPVIPR